MHSDQPSAVMYPYYGTSTVLRSDDVTAVRRIYAFKFAAEDTATVAP